MLHLGFSCAQLTWCIEFLEVLLANRSEEMKMHSMERQDNVGKDSCLKSVPAQVRLFPWKADMDLGFWHRSGQRTVRRGPNGYQSEAMNPNSMVQDCISPTNPVNCNIAAL